MQLFNGDCLEVMKNIPDGSVDMVLCDLPYGTTQSKWDSIIPFDKLWEQYNRIVKENGAIVLFGAEPFASKLRLSNAKYYKYDWIWRKPKGTGHLNAKKQPMRDYENICVFYRKQCLYNPQFEKGEPYHGKGGKIAKPSKASCYGKFMNGNDFESVNTGYRYPKQIIEFGVVERGNLHVNQKPVPLLEYLVKTYTNEGQTVLDNTMGSGSTGVACKNTNREFIGIELDKNFFEIARDRILG